jgi:heme-degrading monooxygenase HmoA
LESSAQYVIVWEFRIRPEKESEFTEHYGSNGSWARFFRNGRGYIRTELVKDVADGDRFLTLDYWQSEEDFSRFRQQNLAEYERLDKELEGLTEQERRLGAFWIEEFAEVQQAKS